MEDKKEKERLKRDPVRILEGYLIGYSGRIMDTLLKTRYNIEFLPQVPGFSEKASNLNSVI
ncbi:hypothetical protein SADUNF_Sadunf06G0028600 [Salix dunnii]|uniref:Uncharacterized protein n=1 Tax=Salix dunnii TaxID=1413687 RepID=A0A835K2T0_9ROSI|nr:hypothetical protein SADUNF_Sadunf06G0028600 [Salix dunnii]